MVMSATKAVQSSSALFSMGAPDTWVSNGDSHLHRDQDVLSTPDKSSKGSDSSNLSTHCTPATMYQALGNSQRAYQLLLLLQPEDHHLSSV
jgi:hypothetical protein